METQLNRVKYILQNMGLNEYQASALAHLMYLGETKATTLSKSSGVPNARIYGVLNELGEKGLINTRPGRPLLYTPLSPREITEALIADTRAEMRKRLNDVESFTDDLVEAAESMYLKASSSEQRTPLIRVVRRGDVSEEETKKLYRGARNEILISTRALEYFDKVKDELIEATTKGVKIKVLMFSRGSLTVDEAGKRDKSISSMKQSMGEAVEIRVTDDVLIRGCVVDPSGEGKALFLVEERGVPIFLREAAITSHPGVVKGLDNLFDLKWRFESHPPD